MAGQLSLKYAGAALLFAVTASISSPAQAGFQWVAPSDASSAPPMVAPQQRTTTPSFLQAPADQADTSGPEIISPVVISGGAAKPVAQSKFDEMPVAPADYAEPMMPEAPVVQPMASPVKTTVKTTTVKSLKPVDNGADRGVVVGFAKSVPLAVAMRQILPSGYVFSIDQDVDMGTLISFNGGRGWRETLRDALSPVGLATRENGQMIEVGFAGHNVVPIASSDVTPTITSQTTTTISSPATITSTSSIDMPIMPMSDTALSPVAATGGWTAERGAHLRKVLEGWSSRANVEFDWMSEYDYPLEASVSFQGTFESAVRSLLTGFEGAHPQPVAELHSNPTLGQMVLVVTTRGNTNSD